MDIKDVVAQGKVIKESGSTPLITLMVCFYIFLVIERPWESIRYLHEIPIERMYAIGMIIIAILSQKFTIVKSSTNKWVYGLLTLHFLLVPFSFSPKYGFDAGIEYAKMVVLYILMLSVAEDKHSLKLLVKAFIFSMMFYMLHSLWEYYNGRHVWRMGISRMVGVDETHSDPNNFGASVVLSLPFVYALLRSETRSLMRKVYFGYFALAVLCVVLTGSRSASIAFVFLFMLWGFAQKGGKKAGILIVVFLSLATVWTVMPEEKRDRIRTIWDDSAGPEGARQSAEGRLVGWKVSWEMFKQQPLTGVGPGGKNYIEYRMVNNIDDMLGSLPSPTQSHILYGEVLAEFGIAGALMFVGLVFSIWKNSTNAMVKLKSHHGEGGDFLRALGKAILVGLLLLFLFGFGGHNFYRPLWLWLAAWSGGLLHIAERVTRTSESSPAAAWTSAKVLNHKITGA